MLQLGDMQCFDVCLQPHKFILGHHLSLFALWRTTNTIYDTLR